MRLRYPQKTISIGQENYALSVEEVKQKYALSHVVSLAANEQPWGASPVVVRALRSLLQKQHRYPAAKAQKLLYLLSQKFGLKEDEFVIGNGTGEIYDILIRALISPGDEVITSCFSFRNYTKYVEMLGGSILSVPLKGFSHDLESILCCISEKTQFLVLDNPINPTGKSLSPGDIYSFISKVPENVVVILDESYVDFVEKQYQIDIFSLIRNIEKRSAVVSIRSFSKLYGLAGLRIGYGVMPAEIAKVLQKVRLPNTVNKMASAGAAAALVDDVYYLDIIDKVIEGRRYLVEETEKMGCSCQPSLVNFIFVDVKGDADKLYLTMLKKGCIVQSLKQYGFSNAIRVAVGTKEENEHYLEALSLSLQECKYV